MAPTDRPAAAPAARRDLVTSSARPFAAPPFPSHHGALRSRSNAMA
jgi:hypothetical protein